MLNRCPVGAKAAHLYQMVCVAFLRIPKVGDAKCFHLRNYPRAINTVVWGLGVLRGLSTCLLLCATMCAWADDNLPDTFGSPVSLTLDLTGTIPTHCGYAALPPATANLGNIASAGSVALPFLLNCNVPYAMKVSSSNGALLRTTAQAAPEGFATSLDYMVSLAVDTDLLPASAQCTSQQLTTSSCILAKGLLSGDGISVGANGALTVSWSASQQQLVAGSYRDQITLTIEVRT